MPYDPAFLIQHREARAQAPAIGVKTVHSATLSNGNQLQTT